jgi:hypothetical protein
MFDLNDDKQFGGVQIFNGGEAGLTKNVEISVEKKQVDDADNHPDYKLLAKDASGATINQGFYYYKPQPQLDSDENKKKEKVQVGRVLSIAKAVMGNDYVFPQVNSGKEAFDVMFKLIEENAPGKKFNVYTTYGTQAYPSIYLGFRYFNFIEPANVEISTLKPNNNDVLVRPEADNDPSEDELSDVSKSALDEL